MVNVTIYKVNVDVFLLCIFPDVIPNISPKILGIKEWHPILGTPYKVNIDTYKWHSIYGLTIPKKNF